MISKQSLYSLYQDLFRPSRFTTMGQVLISALGGPLSFYFYLLCQRLATAKGRVRLGWAAFFMILTTVLMLVLREYAPEPPADPLNREIRALAGLIYLSLYYSVKHPEEQGIPDSSYTLAPVLPLLLAMLLGRTIESGLLKGLAFLSTQF